MDEQHLLDLCMELGKRLQTAGAETYRVEESMSRLLAAYGAKGEVYSIPNCLIVSLETKDGTPLTRMCRVSGHGTDLDAVEQYSGLSRALCTEAPPLEEALSMVRQAEVRVRQYKLPLYVGACLLASAGFALFFGGGPREALAGGLSGALAGLCIYAMDRLHTNQFFRTILAAFAASLVSCLLVALGLCQNLDAAIIGPLTMLVPGFLFTNSMRDIIYGDTMSGVNRLVQVLIISVAIAIGSAFAVSLAGPILGSKGQGPATEYTGAVQCAAAAFACLGYCVLFNIHGPGMLLCALGSGLGWAAYLLSCALGVPETGAYLIAAIFISAYAEIMARIRKYPATSYLVISLFPLFPGAYLYYALSAALRGQTELFLNQTLLAAEIAGALAVGVLLVSTLFRMWAVLRGKIRLR